MTSTQRKLLDWNKANCLGAERIGNARRIMEADALQQEMMIHAISLPTTA